MRREIQRAEAIKLINQGITVKNDTSDGYMTINKKPKGLYETKVYTHGVEKPEILRGNFTSLLKTMNKFNGFYVEDNE